MRTAVAVIVLLTLGATGTVLAQGWSPPPTRVCELGSYACPTHPEIRATWPARCPTCGAVLIPARGGGGAAGAGSTPAGGTPAVEPRGGGRPGVQSTAPGGRGEGGEFGEGGRFGFPNEGFGDQNRRFGFPNEGFGDQNRASASRMKVLGIKISETDGSGERRFPNDEFGEGEFGEEFGEPFSTQPFGFGPDEFGNERLINQKLNNATIVGRP